VTISITIPPDSKKLSLENRLAKLRKLILTIKVADEPIHLQDSVRALLREAQGEIQSRVIEGKARELHLQMFKDLGISRHAEDMPGGHRIFPASAARDIEIILKILSGKVASKRKGPETKQGKRPQAYALASVKMEIRKLYKLGWTQLRICRHLDEHKYPCPPGVRWRSLGWEGALKSKELGGAKSWITRHSG
jgi:hypothetical protein